MARIVADDNAPVKSLLDADLVQAALNRNFGTTSMPYSRLGMEIAIGLNAYNVVLGIFNRCPLVRTQESCLSLLLPVGNKCHGRCDTVGSTSVVYHYLHRLQCKGGRGPALKRGEMPSACRRSAMREGLPNKTTI